MNYHTKRTFQNSIDDCTSIDSNVSRYLYLYHPHTSHATQQLKSSIDPLLLSLLYLDYFAL